MDIYNAIMRAADVIETNPALYAFQKNIVPACGSPGCLIGHIGAHLGHTGQSVFMGDTWTALGFDPESRDSVLQKMDYFKWSVTERPHHLRGLPVTRDARVAALFLRYFAQRYKPEPLPFVDLPAAVRAIFDDSKFNAQFESVS
jgi:hypothetical protein